MLDTAAHGALMLWSLREFPDTDVQSVALQLLELGGVDDVSVLLALKEQGKSLYGQRPTTGRGTLQDTEGLREDAAALLKGLPAVVVPQDKALTPGPGWELPTADSAIDFSILEITYTGPLAG